MSGVSARGWGLGHGAGLTALPPPRPPRPVLPRAPGASLGGERGCHGGPALPSPATGAGAPAPCQRAGEGPVPDPVPPRPGLALQRLPSPPRNPSGASPPPSPRSSCAAPPPPLPTTAPTPRGSPSTPRSCRRHQGTPRLLLQVRIWAGGSGIRLGVQELPRSPSPCAQQRSSCRPRSDRTQRGEAGVSRAGLGAPGTWVLPVRPPPPGLGAIGLP